MASQFFADIKNHKTPPSYRYFDGSTWRESSSGATVEVFSPVTGRVIGTLAAVGQDEIDHALHRATVSQPGWEQTPLHKRVTIMHLAADWIRHFAIYLTNLLAAEIGKTQAEAQSEIKRTADLIDYFADEALSLRGETLDSDNFPGYDKGRIALIERVAYGTVVAIAPFNYPVNLSASKIAPALLMGNSVVYKPPTQGGISGLHLVQIFHKAGVPNGVLTALTGEGKIIGDALVSHREVDLITFTGSSDTGISIAKKAGMVPLVFECGGNNPALVLTDADISLAAKEIVKGAFSYAGQRCTAIKYVLGTKSILSKLLENVLETMKDMVHMGDPRSPKTKLVGPLIAESAARHIEEVIGSAVAEGATIAIGGTRDGSYIAPTILTHVTPHMQVVTEEIFGPVVSFIEVSSLKDAIEIVNKSRFGLQASVFTADEGAGLAIARQLAVGTVQINGSPQRGPDHFPFLGVKKSGVGVQGVRYSLESMSRLRPVVFNKPS